MSKTVRVKVTSSDKVVALEESAALRFVKADPKEYRILEPPKVEVLNLPPLEPQKKSVVVAEDKQEKSAKEEAIAAEVHEIVDSLKNIASEPKRMGRPPKQK